MGNINNGDSEGKKKRDTQIGKETEKRRHRKREIRRCICRGDKELYTEEEMQRGERQSERSRADRTIGKKKRGVHKGKRQ